MLDPTAPGRQCKSWKPVFFLHCNTLAQYPVEAGVDEGVGRFHGLYVIESRAGGDRNIPDTATIRGYAILRFSSNEVFALRALSIVAIFTAGAACLAVASQSPARVNAQGMLVEPFAWTASGRILLVAAAASLIAAASIWTFRRIRSG